MCNRVCLEDYCTQLHYFRKSCLWLQLGVTNYNWLQLQPSHGLLIVLQIDLLKHVNKSRTECLNESDEHTLQHAIHQCDEDYLESDCDEQVGDSCAFTHASVDRV